MEKSITIHTEIQNRGCWVKINIPYSAGEEIMASIFHENSELLKKVQLSEGNNAIDISGIYCQYIQVKVETPFETILKIEKIIQP
jgi:hypothetical protein